MVARVPRSCMCCSTAAACARTAATMLPVACCHSSRAMMHLRAALVKWMRTLEGTTGANQGNHSPRHGTKDLLRAVDFPDSVRDQITGHKTPGTGANYGQGYPPDMLAGWLVKATKTIHLAT